MTDQLAKLLTTEEVAEILNLKPETLAKWRVTKPWNYLPYTVVGGRPRYHPDDVLAFQKKPDAAGIEAFKKKWREKPKARRRRVSK
jgi:hypothetical protein